MSKSLLFVCLVLVGVTAVLGNTQIRLINAQISTSNEVGLAASLTDVGNTTLFAAVVGNQYGLTTKTIPKSAYVDLPVYQYPIGEEITLWGITPQSGVISTVLTPESLNVTLEENQSYSVVYMEKTADLSGDWVFDNPPRTDFPAPVLFIYEERPNPSPFGKALLKIVNVALATFESSMTLTINGTDVESRQVTLSFGQGSEFLEYDTASDIVVYTSLPAVFEDPTDGTTSTGFLDRIFSISLAMNKTTVLYIRGDVAGGNPLMLGDLVTQVDWTFPPTPDPPMDAPVDVPAEPMAEEPVATPTAAIPVRAPITKVSSAAQTAAQIIGVAGMAFLLF